MGFKTVANYATYEECLTYLRANKDQIADAREDPHYVESLDIIDEETGRLMSWVL